MSKILTFGVFDYFHLGHLRLFKQCKMHGDYLIVAVQDSNEILKYKPNAKVMYSNEERMEIIKELKLVDEVIIYKGISIETLQSIDFDILALGEDHKGGRFDVAEQWCIDNKKKVIRLKRTPNICSSEIKNNIN